MERLTSPLPDQAKACAFCVEPGQEQAGIAARPACVCDAHDEALEGLVARASQVDPEGPDHPKRVGQIASILGEEVGLPAEERDLLARAAALHDIGKMALPEGVLGHRDVLDEEGRRQMERHTLLGASILAHAKAPWMRLAGIIALTHHERWDGSGYPAGLRGEDIPLAGRLVAVADVYDALRSDRPYKDAQDHEEALQRILQGDGRIAPSQFDPVILAALRRRDADIAAVPR
ncbi:HD domain-containing protein [Roseomonas sp. HJA6]|uniref:HD domain-containing protein n=1 Tax=Roseomonas alba TaxID=2846776 RepID=A0ABS7A5N9_9PROT|nr:HD domain-containing phosphohydrolase [Neoroseomonas alba]MBW6397508.1 HD domain-containing protein [Neoroseomonas alba]